MEDSEIVDIIALYPASRLSRGKDILKGQVIHVLAVNGLASVSEISGDFDITLSI